MNSQSYKTISNLEIEENYAPTTRSKWRTPLIICTIISATAILALIFQAQHATSFSDPYMAASKGRAESNCADCMSICDNPAYSKTTLKAAYEDSFIALMKDTKHQKKFEASDVIVVEDNFYAVCDNSWAIEKLSDQLIPFSDANIQIGEPEIDGKPDSGYEAIFHDDATDIFYVVRESVPVDLATKKKSRYHAIVEELRISDNKYSLINECIAELEFEGESKGFEGAVGLKSASGELYMLGLCEGNHCKEGKEGKDKGHGLAVLMRKDTSAKLGDYTCVWKTQRFLKIPDVADFQDYSALSITAEGRVAITSQEESQVWIGHLTHVRNGVFDPEKSEFSTSKMHVYNFPRDTNCEIIYCNIEGIHWINDELLVAVSDKMKKGGKQDFRCLNKDQSIHVFVLP